MIACAFDHRTKMLPFVYANLRMAPAGVRAIGAAMLAHEYMDYQGNHTRFKGFAAAEMDYATRSFECQGCSNRCEIVRIQVDGATVARWGSRCGKWDLV